MIPVLTAIAAGAGAAAVACGLLVAVWIAWCEVARALDRRKNARSAPVTPVDGSHEACELTNQEWGAAEYLSRRYPSLGREVTR